jgi:toxin ParE1/3/4
MARIRWTIQAIQDIEAICEFIARDAPRYSHIFANRIVKSTRRLKSFPFSGRIVPEIGVEYIREIILGNYRLIYRIRNKEVQILTIYHSARLIDSEQIQQIN